MHVSQEPYHKIFNKHVAFYARYSSRLIKNKWITKGFYSADSNVRVCERASIYADDSVQVGMVCVFVIATTFLLYLNKKYGKYAKFCSAINQ